MNARRFRSVVLIGLVLVTCAMRRAEAIDFTYRVVALKGAPAPGCPEGVVFGRTNRPAIDANGRVAFTSFLMGTDVTNANDTGLFSEQFGPLDLVIREGDPAPDLDPGIFIGNIQGNVGGTTLLSRNGYNAFIASLTGSVVTTDDTGIWIDRGGGLELAAREGDPAPEAEPGLYGFFSPPILSADGKLVYRSRIGTLSQSPTGTWHETDTTPSFICLAGTGGGSPAPGTTGNFQSAGTPVRNGLGHLAFAATIQGAGVTTLDNGGIWRQSDGPLSLFLREGDDAIDLPDGVVFDAFPPVHIDDLGHLAFAAFVRGTGITSANQGGIWSEASGDLHLVARLGDPAPDCADGVAFASFNAFSNEGFAVSNDGRIAFDATLTGTGVTSANSRGIWAQTADGTVRKVARMGDDIDGLPSGVTYSFFSAFEINRNGLIIFDALLTGPGVTSSNNAAIFAVQLNQAPRIVLRTGDSIEVAPGESRILRPLLNASLNVGTADGTPITLNDHGQLAVYSDFTDITNAILVVEIPACALPGDVNLDQVVDGGDVANFVDCVLGASIHGCPCGDFDDDLSVTPADVPDFVTMLLGL